MGNNILSLLQLADPALPIGSYAHSAGLETYIQLKLVRDAASAKAFVTQMLSQNLHYTDAYMVSLAYNAAEENDSGRISGLDEECTALKMPMEIRQASRKLGIRLLKNFQPFCDHALVNDFLAGIHRQSHCGHYCIAFGMLASVMHISKPDALAGFYYNAAAGMVTNCVKLVPLGQQKGQEILFTLQPLISNLVQDALQPDMDMLGLCCPGFDIRAMQHEQLYSRLYMS